MTKIIRFSDHAEQRMVERNVNRLEVLDSINAPESFRKDNYGRKGMVWQLERRFGRDTLRVVADIVKGTNARPTPLVDVLTVYWLGYQNGVRP